jgi:hypothetical protein
VWLPQSFVLINTIPNPIGALTSGEMSRKMPSSFLRSKTLISLMGASKAMCQAPLFFVKILAISSIQPVAVFHLVATLCENGGTPKVMVRSKDTFVPPTVPHLIFEANHMEHPRFNLNLNMWLWPNFTTFQHGQPLIKLMLFLGLWLCTLRKECFS